MPSRIPKTITLRSGYEMPRLGYGVFQVPAISCPALVSAALSLGYTHIDTATVYRNESACATAVHRASTTGIPCTSPPSSTSPPNATTVIPRSQIFFTTKLPPKLRGYDATFTSIQRTIEENPGLQGYVDLYLIHAPYGGKENRLAEWRAMRDAWRRGWVRSLGVSNYSIAHMEELREWIAQEEGRTGEPGAGGIISVGQWEMHPWCPRSDILAYCTAHNIVAQAYTPLVRGTRFRSAPTAETPNPSTPPGSEYLYALAEKYGKTPAQILLRWSLQRGCVPIVKTVSEERLKENIGVWGWELQDADVEGLLTSEYLPICWDPVVDCKD